ncbi:MAG: cell division protein FtsQ/DivIB [Alphaproteobacteria bacterium]|nr:cell division protein FtsQ/DivIB [Alphaproteobacteria bacterium]
MLSIVLATYFSTKIIITSRGQSGMSQVHKIYVNADTANADLTAVASAAAVTPGTNSYALDLQQVNARVALIPGVKNSAVHRRPDGNLDVIVSFYKTIAVWTDGEKFYPLSADGTIVKEPSNMHTPESVLFRGKLPNDISGITAAARGIVRHLDYLEWIEGRRWNLITTGGTTIMLPEKNPETAIASLIVLHQNNNILNKDIQMIDMRDDMRILVK